MATRKKVLFLQLPQLDNDLKGDTENIPLAAAYLRYAAEQAGEDRYYTFESLPDSLQTASTPILLATIVQRSPSIIAATLYLWNIERTLRLIRSLQTRQPGIRILLGGPEAATSHPFLFKESVADAIAVGEGETVFPALLKSFRTGRQVDFSTVALKTKRGYRWGTLSPAPVDLSRQLPPPDYAALRPDDNGMAYLETSRGCPMHCTYCRYPHLRRSMSFLEPTGILRRVAALRRLGAREIRLVDPTFNAHPRFRDIIRRLSILNRNGAVKFFAELNAERVTDRDAHLLAKARFTEIEVGVQSRDPKVLALIRRPTSLERLDAGIRRLLSQHIKVTVDIMYGLPGQGYPDVRRSLAWASKLRGASVQCLQTLLLPGTELRDRRQEWKLKYQPRPPYAVIRTGTMDETDFRRVETLLSRNPRLRSDVPTPRFVGPRLDLFTERIRVTAGQETEKGQACRRAYLLTGRDLYGDCAALSRFIRTTLRREPDSLFQFVLCPSQEEPLDLLDELIAVIRRQPPHLTDRYAPLALGGKIASRRLMVKLPVGRMFSRTWINAAEHLLGSAFF
ncbi:MAG: B12-binding domain-containing radical SAM protein [bacterium]